ncbi:MAG TPA: S9 family peptidase [Terriglobales bacterium]|nr:S9 family peptidase [Terriglobales bacterium]
MRTPLVFMPAIGFYDGGFRCEIACVYSAPMIRRNFFTSLLLCALSGSAVAQDRIAVALDSLPAIKKVDQVAISPDGKNVAYIVDGGLSVASLAGGDAHRIAPDQKVAARDVTWSADSKKLAWLGDLPTDIPAAELWSASADGSDLIKLADLKGFAETLRYSPDGAKLAVLYIEGMPRIAGPLQPMTPLAGVVGEKVYEQRIAVVDIGTMKLTQVTPSDVYVYEYDWTPDSKAWVVSAAHGSGDNNWWLARLYAIDAGNGNMREIYKPKWQIAEPHVSPDGKSVAFIEGLMSDAGLTGGDIQLVAMSGGSARNLTPGIKASPSSLAWTGTNQIAVIASVDGNAGYTTITTDGHSTQSNWKGWTGEETIGTATDVYALGASFSLDGTVSAVVRQAASTPPEVWAGPMGSWKQLTHVNGDIHATWGESRNVHWMNGDTRVQGWLMLPKDYDPAKKYPLVISVHGGPSWGCLSQWSAGKMGDMTAGSLLGWFVLCPNPRGSYGQGEAFTQGNVKDFGGGDYKDIMAGVDAMTQQFPIDPKRIGLRGHSYGGYMAMWAETQTTRFAAVVAGAGLADFLSYYGQNDIDEWMIPFFGASVYDDPAVYQKSDPIHFVKNVKTPTLILVGDRDGEVPMPQSIEWYHALQAMKVPTQMVVYPNEGHVFYRPADARDYTLRTLRWFEEWFGK